MSYELTKHNDIAIVSVKLDIATSDDARDFNKYLRALIEDGETKIIVDLTKCDIIRSPFLGALVAAYKLIKLRNGSIKLVWAPLDKSSIFVFTRLDKVLKVYLTLNEALEAWGDESD